jgi:hypothetical protein
VVSCVAARVCGSSVVVVVGVPLVSDDDASVVAGSGVVVVCGDSDDSGAAVVVVAGEVVGSSDDPPESADVVVLRSDPTPGSMTAGLSVLDGSSVLVGDGGGALLFGTFGCSSVVDSVDEVPRSGEKVGSWSGWARVGDGMSAVVSGSGLLSATSGATVELEPW